jgi:hypothetical protein
MPRCEVLGAGAQNVRASIPRVERFLPAGNRTVHRYEARRGTQLPRGQMIK